jgi:hypothetical protein
VARGALADGLRVTVFSDTYAPQVNGVSRTLERLVGAVEARGGEARVVTVEDPDAAPDARVERWPRRRGTGRWTPSIGGDRRSFMPPRSLAWVSVR